MGSAIIRVAGTRPGPSHPPGIILAPEQETVDWRLPSTAADAHKGLTMDDRSRIALMMGVGAAVGGFVGFLLFTDRGRAFRRELEPQLEEFFGEAQRLTAAFDKTRKAVQDGLSTLKNEAGSKGEANPDWSH
jgi:hypothetical protein